MSDLLAGLVPWPIGDFSMFGPVEQRPLSFIAERLAAADLFA